MQTPAGRAGPGRQRRRYRHRAAGLCPVCGKRPPAPRSVKARSSREHSESGISRWWVSRAARPAPCCTTSLRALIDNPYDGSTLVGRDGHVQAGRALVAAGAPGQPARALRSEAVVEPVELALSQFTAVLQE